MPFNFQNISSVEFGVCVDSDSGETFVHVPVVGDVQTVIKEMVKVTKDSILEGNQAIREFCPAEKYAHNEPLRLPLSSEMITKHKAAYLAENFITNTSVLSEPENIIGYFAVLRDNQQNKLMAFRRATQFKGILKHKLIKFSDDALRIVPDNVFKLDHDFDFLIFDDQVLIWRPSGFEFSADLEAYIAASTVANISSISSRLTCVHFDHLSPFVQGHKRAMRIVAAIKSRDDLEHTSLDRLKSFCLQSNVTLVEENGKIWPSQGHELQFLLILDRRRYSMSLTDNGSEIYEATSRHRA